MKNFLKTFERVFVYYFASMGASVLIGVLLNVPMKLLLGNKFDDFASFLIGIISLLISMFVLFFIDGYRTKRFELKRFLISELMLLSLLIVVIYFIGRAIYISGPTDYLAWHILKKVNPTLINGKAILNKYCLVLMISAYVVLYAPLMLIAEFLGCKSKVNNIKKIIDTSKSNSLKV